MTAALVTARFSNEGLRRLESTFESVRTAGFGVDGRILPAADLRRLVRDIDVLVVEFETVDAEILDGAPNLRVIACCRNEPGASVDLQAATDRGIPVLFTPGRNAVSVAEYTLGLMISIARRIPQAHHLLRFTEELTAASHDDSGSRRDATAQWSLDPGAPFDRFQGPELSGRTIGLVGFGLIGREIAVRAAAFGMRIITFDPFAPDDALIQHGVERTTLDELAKSSDFVVVAAKVTPESRGIVSSEFFAKMKPTAYFINTARAALVDYGALERTLTAGSIAGAALDVYPTEPLPAKSILRGLDNVVLSPHLAGASTDVVMHHSRQITDDIERVFRGEHPRSLANPAISGLEGVSE